MPYLFNYCYGKSLDVLLEEVYPNIGIQKKSFKFTGIHSYSIISLKTYSYSR